MNLHTYKLDCYIWVLQTKQTIIITHMFEPRFSFLDIVVIGLPLWTTLAGTWLFFFIYLRCQCTSKVFLKGQVNNNIILGTAILSNDRGQLVLRKHFFRSVR